MTSGFLIKLIHCKVYQEHLFSLSLSLHGGLVYLVYPFRMHEEHKNIKPQVLLTLKHSPTQIPKPKSERKCGMGTLRPLTFTGKAKVTPHEKLQRGCG